MKNRVIAAGVTVTDTKKLIHNMSICIEFDEPISEQKAVKIVEDKIRELVHKNIEVEE